MSCSLNTSYRNVMKLQTSVFQVEGSNLGQLTVCCLLSGV